MNPNTTPMQPEEFRFGEFVLSVPEHNLKRAGRPIPLRPKTFETLVFLLIHHGRLVTKDELLESLWPGVVVTEGTLSHCIEEIRNALADDFRNPAFVQTVPRVGFRFIADVEQDRPDRFEEEVEEEEYTSVQVKIRPDNETETGGMPVHGRPGIPLHPRIVRRRRMGALTAVALAAMLALAGFFWLRNDGRKPITSLVVVPFENLSGDAGEEYFADGLTDALISEVARFGHLRVISRTSAMQYKHTTRSLSQIAAELRVDAVIEGSVFRSGTKVRVSAAMVAAEGERHLWSETYERHQRDMVELLRVMARTLAREIHAELSENQEVILHGGKSVDPAAYEAYLKGRFFWNKRTPDGFRKGIEFFDRALAADPHYAPAYVGLADCYNMLGDYDALPPGIAFTKSRAAALHALAIDNSLSDAHASLAFAAMHYDRTWNSVEKEFELAITLNPSCSNAHHWYALYLTMQGRPAEAEVEMGEAVSLDPLSLIVRTNSGWILYFSREYGRAIDLYRDALQLDSNFVPAHIKLGWAYEQTGRYEDALGEFRRAFALSGKDPAVSLMIARASALAGDRTEARARVDAVTKTGNGQYISSYHVAAAYAGMGEKETALTWLRHAHREQNGWLSWLKMDPKFDGLRGHPGFSALLDSLGFKP